MAKRRGIASITAEQARNALTYLVHEGKVTAKAVEKALANRERLIREIRERMAALGGAAAEGFRQAEKASRKPRRKAVSAATRAARKAQGRYMAAVRRLSKSARKQIKAIRQKSGVKAAIAKAKRMAK
jgi:hypothetical protein